MMVSMLMIMMLMIMMTTIEMSIKKTRKMIDLAPVAEQSVDTALHASS